MVGDSFLVTPGLGGVEVIDAVLEWRVEGCMEASQSSRSMKLMELELLRRLSLRISANQSGISASGVRGVDMPDGGFELGSKVPEKGPHPVGAF